MLSSIVQRPASRLALGTANWGARYGAPGQEAKVDRFQAAELGQLFLADGHDLVDTAPAYGQAEFMVGDIFRGAARVITKIPAHVLDLPDAGADALRHLRRSADRTQVRHLAGALFHEPDTAIRETGRAKQFIEMVRDLGLSEKIGVSVYTPQQAIVSVELLGADLIQIPCNLLDQRFVASGCITELKSAGVEVHVRSVFLNGTLLADSSALAPPLQALASGVGHIHRAAGLLGLTPLELAVAYVRDIVQPAAVVVGAFQTWQLADILRAWSTPLPTESASIDWTSFASQDAKIIDPRSWRK